jgi:transposase
MSSELPREKMAAAEVVASYKKLGLVEEAFRNLKTVQLEVRPVFHKTDDRIRSHVFLCTLAYYLQWHFKQRLGPFFAADGTKKIESGPSETSLSDWPQSAKRRYSWLE